MDKPLSEMTNDEIIEEINLLRDRRVAARERRRQASPAERSDKKQKNVVEEVSGELGALLDDILK